MSDTQQPGPPAESANRLSLGVSRQMEIYMAGMTGRQPSQPLAPEELERMAQAALPARAYVYVSGGAGGDGTVRANLAAFQRWRTVPRHP